MYGTTLFSEEAAVCRQILLSNLC